MVWGLLAGLAAAILYGVPEVLQAIASRRLPDGRWWQVVIAGARDPLMAAVMGLYLLGYGMHVIAIELLPLYLAQSVIAASLIFTALAAVHVLAEWPRPLQWFCLGAVCLGLTLLALAAGPVGKHDFGENFTVLLSLCWVLLAGVSVLAARVRGTVGGVVLGLVSGLAFAGTPIATRAIADPSPDLRTLLTAVAVALYGILGFGTYSLALQRVRVILATAPMIVTQTVIPAIVGIFFLADGIRPGWWIAIVAGLAISLAGAIGLAGAEIPETLPVAGARSGLV